MSALFHAFDPARLCALTRAGTIMGGGFADIPDLPLTSWEIDLPTPALVLPSPAILRPAAHVVDETRVLALHLHRNRQHLTGWDRLLVRELIRWRGEPSTWEADQIAALAEQHYWRIRDGAAPC